MNTITPLDITKSCQQVGLMSPSPSELTSECARTGGIDTLSLSLLMHRVQPHMSEEVSRRIAELLSELIPPPSERG